LQKTARVLLEGGRIRDMALPQRDNLIDAIKRTDALLEYAVMHDDAEEAERLREKLKRLTEKM